MKRMHFLLLPIISALLFSCPAPTAPSPAGQDLPAGTNLVLKVESAASRSVSGDDAEVRAMDLAVKSADGSRSVASAHWEKEGAADSFSFSLDARESYRLDVIQYYLDSLNVLTSAADAPYPFAVRAGKVTRITVTPGGIAVVDIPGEVPSGFRVSGRVRADGLPLAGVAVSLEGTSRSVLTDAAGFFEIGGLSPGSYRIGTALAGYSILPDSYSRRVEVSSGDVAGQDFSAFKLAAASIDSIQGKSHISPLNGKAVGSAIGIVTLVDAKQFTMQSPDPDEDPSTSEGILVYLNASPAVAAGDLVAVSGTVSEYYPNGASYGGLSVTEIKSPTIQVLARGRALPAPAVIGAGGRVPPASVICDDAVSGLVDSSPFDPANDGIDFYESLEFMRVQVNEARVANPTIFYASSDYRETYLLGDGGAGATGLSARGGIVLSESDFNPEIIAINDKFHPAAIEARVNDRFPGATVGVLDYSYGIYKIFITQALPALVRGSLPKESTELAPAASSLTVASFNAENISPADPAAKFERCADAIVNSLKSPDILIVCEVQDDNGEAAGGTGAQATWNAIIAAVAATGGPAYQYRQIDPQNNADGGAPDGNIRQGFLFNPLRVQFVDRPGGDGVTAITVSNEGGGALLSCSPGRIDPGNAAFASSRKPLVGEFIFQGKKLFLIANHLNSKGGDSPLWGRSQPPVLSSQTQRMAQVQALASFIGQILAIEPGANILLGGDLNDFEFSAPLRALVGAGLEDLVERIPRPDRYTYLYSGNCQVLDHLMVSAGMAAKSPEIDIVHIDAEYPDSDRVSDHDPLVARFAF